MTAQDSIRDKIVDDIRGDIEVREAINRLSPADSARLHAVAVLLCWGLSGYEADDLFQEAIKRVLDKARRFPPLDNPECSFQAFLFETMRSIANSWRRDPQESRTVREQIAIQSDNYGDSTISNIRSPEKGADEVLIRKETVEFLRSLTPEKDRQILDAKLEGWTRAEIQTRFGMTIEQYVSSCKTIARRLKLMRELAS